MKNKKLLLIVSIVLAMTMSLGGTLAYLTDTDADVNTMVLGNVKIEQHEYQRVGNDTDTYTTETIDNVTSYVLEEFKDGKMLLPIVGDPNEPKDSPAYKGWDENGTTVRMTQVGSYGGMQVAGGKNAMDKFVTVENTGNTPAYVRTYVALEVGSTQNKNAEGKPLVKTFSRATDAAKPDSISPWLYTNIGIVEINGNNYAVIEYVYRGASDVKRHENGVLPAKDTTYPNLCQVYLKHYATNEDLQALDGNANGTYDIIVLSQAVQADGFKNAQEALEAGFTSTKQGENGESVKDTTIIAGWLAGASSTLPQVATDVNELKAQLEAGNTDIVVNGAQITENPFNGAYYKDSDIFFYDCTFTANMNYMYINNATYTNCTFDCGSANSAVHYDELWGDLVFNNCNFVSGQIKIGTNEEGDATVTFNDCVFGATESTNIWAEKGIRVYSPVEFNDCAFNNRVVLAGSNGLSVSFNSCTMTDAEGKTIPVYYKDNTDGIIRGGNVPTVTIK